MILKPEQQPGLQISNHRQLVQRTGCLATRAFPVPGVAVPSQLATRQVFPADSHSQSRTQHGNQGQRYGTELQVRAGRPHQHRQQTGKPQRQQQAEQKNRTPQRVGDRRGVMPIQDRSRIGAQEQDDQSASNATKDQRAVGAAKSEVVFDRNIEFGVTRRVGTKVQVALRILVKDIDGGRNLLMMQRQHGKD